MAEIILALCAGFLMNLMPCVLPVLLLKIKAFGGKKLPYVSGVMLSFMVLATLSVTLGTGLSQMGNQWYRVSLVMICFAMGTHLIGMWQMPSFGVRGDYGPFGMGCLTTALGSSCSVPFLAPIMAYTITCEWYETYLLFGALGLGFVSPFFLPLSGLIKRFGDYVTWIEPVCGVAMIAVSIWLWSTLPDETMWAVMALIGAVSVCMSEVSNWKLQKPPGGFCSYMGTGLFFLALICNGTAKQPTEPVQQDWPTEGPRIVFVTADWCINCKAAKMTLSSAEVLAALWELDITPTIVDYTDLDARVAEFLLSYGHRDVPFCLIENQQGEITVLSGLWTSGQVVEALRVDAQ